MHLHCCTQTTRDKDLLFPLIIATNNCILVIILIFQKYLQKKEKEAEPLTGGGCVNGTKGIALFFAWHRNHGISQKHNALKLDYSSCSPSPVNVNR